MPARRFDIIIIGSGSAGVSAAEAAVEAGANSVAVVEAAERLGGECPNWGCVPTKALLRSVEVLELARRAEEFGLRLTKPGFDFGAMMARKQGIVDVLTGHGRIETLLGMLHVEVICGPARFVAKNAIEVMGERYAFRKCVIATGSKLFVPLIPGLDGVRYLSSDDLVSLKAPPRSIVIIGGGPIGVESAQILAPLGTDVTIVERFGHILPNEDAEIAAIVQEEYAKRGVRVLVSASVTAVAQSGKKISATVRKGDGAEETVSADAIMVATGKRPVVRELDAEKAGVEIDEHDMPKVDAFLATTNPNIFVAGDAAGQLLFTHVAHEQGVIAATNAIKGNVRTSDLSVVPRGTFCTPEVGSVGLTEKDAAEKGFDVATGRAPYSYFGKALVTGEMAGLVKIVADRKTGLVLGGHVVGQAAAELVHELALAIYAKVPYALIGEMIHAYPTYAEAIGAAAYAIN